MSIGNSLIFNHRGNLTPGIIKDISLLDFQQFFVASSLFTTSKTRERNYHGFLGFIEQIKQANLFPALTKVWMDGSFVTNKPNPKDIDLVIFLNATHPATNMILSNKGYFRNIGGPLHCDPYFVVDYRTVPIIDPSARSHFESEQKYWMGQFCFDRNEEPKGIIELTRDKL